MTGNPHKWTLWHLVSASWIVITPRDLVSATPSTSELDPSWALGPFLALDFQVTPFTSRALYRPCVSGISSATRALLPSLWGAKNFSPGGKPKRATSVEESTVTVCSVKC